MLRPPIRALPSAIVDTEKVLREADGSVELVVVRPHADGKVFAPGVRLESRTVRAGELVRSPKNASATSTSGSLEPMIMSKIMPTYLLLVFEMTIFRNPIRSGMAFYYQ